MNGVMHATMRRSEALALGALGASLPPQDLEGHMKGCRALGRTTGLKFDIKMPMMSLQTIAGGQNNTSCSKSRRWAGIA